MIWQSVNIHNDTNITSGNYVPVMSVKALTESSSCVKGNMILPSVNTINTSVLKKAF